MSDNRDYDGKRSNPDSGDRGNYKKLKTNMSQEEQLNDIFKDPVGTGAYSNTSGNTSNNNAGEIDFNKYSYNNSNIPQTNLNQGFNGNTVSFKQEVGSFPYQSTQYNLSSTASTATDKLLGDQKLHTNDPSKLNDALAASGVDIQHEEELLIQQQQQRNYGTRTGLPTTKAKPFLEPYHVASFMTKVARENGIQQHFLNDTDLLDLISSSCEQWISNILTKTIILSQHRRRGIPNNQMKKNDKKANSQTSVVRSELSKELRNLAVKQKDLEEKRVNKRIILGLEKTSDDPNDPNNTDGKAGAEETLHRAANATAAMMSLGGRKKYSWMNAGNSKGTESKQGSVESNGKGKISPIISVRGDNGLRFREIRLGETVNVKDLLAAIEDERIGTTKAVVKGYAKLRE